MALRLSSTELRHIRRATGTLLSPMDHTSIDGWRRAVNREVSALVGADAAVFMFPGVDGPLVYSEEITQEQLASYPELQPPLTAEGESVLARTVADRVVTIESAYRRSDHGFYRSAYYHEHFGQAGMHSLVCMGHSFTGIRRSAGIGAVATMQPMRARGARRAFGERERQIVELVQPAFVAGLVAWRQFSAAREELLTMLDGLGHAVLVCDATGRRIHETPALEALLATEPEDAILRDTMRRTALACGSGGATPSGQGSSLLRDVRTAAARYQIRASLYFGVRSGGPSDGSPPLVLVAIERQTAVIRTDVELRAEFGLTPAQLRVARLVADGKRNDEIAAMLGVSSFTIRRHTEQVLRKLGASSRAAVAARLYK